MGESFARRLLRAPRRPPGDACTSRDYPDFVTVISTPAILGAAGGIVRAVRIRVWCDGLGLAPTVRADIGRAEARVRRQPLRDGLCPAFR